MLPQSLLLLALLGLAHTAIDHQEFLNKKNVTEFVVNSGQVFELINSLAKAPAPKLRFSLTNTKLDDFSHKSEHSNMELWSLNLTDGSRLEIEVHHPPSKTLVNEYHIQWFDSGTNPKLEAGPKREICFHYGFNGASWFNSYQSHTPSWPMDTTKNTALTQFGYLHHSEQTQEKEFDQVLEYLFVNSDGFGVLLQHDYPWFIRRDPGQQDPVLCFSTNSTTAPYEPDPLNNIYSNLFKHFKLILLSGANARDVTEHAHKMGAMDPPTGIPRPHLWGSPIWIAPGPDPKQATKSTQDLVGGFLDKLTELGFPKNGDIILDSSWHPKNQLAFDSVQYPTVDTLVAKIHDSGFRFGLQVSGHLPRASGTKFTEDFYIRTGKDNTSTDHLDFTNSKTQKYFEDLLQLLSMEEKVDTILGEFFDVPADFRLSASDAKRTPGLLTKRYVTTLEKIFQTGSTQVIVDMAFNSQNNPVFTRLHNYYRGITINSLLGSLIPNVLAVSLAGYSYMIPYTIGGTRYYSQNPNAEQYIRWVQASALLPRLAIATPPWELGFNQSITDLTKKFVTLHTEHSKLFADLVWDRTGSGAPMVRPMWFAEPADPKAYKISDQFMVGEDLVVAPVLVEGVRERAVYLPTGAWVDQHGVQHSGPGSVTVKVPLEELAYFHRKK